MILTQLGVGPEDGFTISDSSSVWSDLLSDSKKLEAVKSFIFLKVKLLFDPPTNSFAIESTNNLISESNSKIKLF